MPDQERTERPTGKRRQETRQKGRVAKSREVSSYLVLMGGIVILYFAGSYMVRELALFMKTTLVQAASTRIEGDDVAATVWRTVTILAKVMAPFLVAVCTGAVLGNLIQVGFLFSWEPLTPKLSKLNPLEGVRRLVSVGSLTELVKFMAKLLLVGAVVYGAIRKEIPSVMPLADQSIPMIGAYICKTICKIMLRTSWVLLALAVLDYAYQRWEFEKSIKMTKQEVKDEYKQSEGDPLVKSRIRRVQREWARRRMMEAVPEADVVITNPLELAVAVAYRNETMAAPRVLAKGAGAVAERIRQIARSHGIPIVENKPLARALFKEVDVGEQIPATLYKVMAEVLAYVYRIKNRLGRP
ncbi:MAG: flagellar biosynthesis protein FlhB [Deltaproteobacteria bacterium]|nr:flagellar biosynthesis protein FlhB [Deltaproteobacteria bacterium]